jgi:hypothetical protein
MKRYPRKKKFISPREQLTFALWLIIYALVFTGLIFILLFVPPVANWMNPGIDYEVVGDSMLMVSVSGTAVVIEKQG